SGDTKIPRMSDLRSVMIIRAGRLVLLAACVTSCKRTRDAAPAHAAPPNASVVFPVYTDSTVPDTLQLDASTLRGDSVSLIGHGGVVDAVPVLSAGSKEWAGDECVEWPTATLGIGGDTSRAAGWTVGFVQERVTGVALDSLQGMSGSDSANFAADLTRLASALPDDTSRTFRGIPFSVRYAYRFQA